MCNVVVPTSCLWSQDDDDEGGENDDDDDDGFFVPHGYLSDGEGALVEEEVCVSMFTSKTSRNVPASRCFTQSPLCLTA